MNEKSIINNLSTISLPQIKERIKRIIEDIPKEKGKIITYSKNFTLSLSNYCINQCKYCFYNHKIFSETGNKNTILLENDKISILVENALKYDCKEGLLISGEDPGSFPEVKVKLERLKIRNYIFYVKKVCDFLLNKKILPHINIGLVKIDDFKILKEYTASMGLMLESTSPRLYEKGGVHENSPSKLPNKRIKHLINAGKLKIPFTTGLLIGIGESLKDRIKDLLLIKNIHEKYGHIQEIIIQNFEKKEGINYQPKRKVPIEELLKITGIARIMFNNEISIQVPPNLISGFEKDFIEMGINDFGGISPITIDHINPKKKWPQIENLKKICKMNGYNLKERLAVYDKFKNNSSFLSKRVRNIIHKYTQIKEI
ncbi:MAG: 7,8-didemethyl-8-hydroxy-5-deazariboflavin synthase subunit CofG [Candidatus Lokiarchaeota archaeon]|nr:7,8-didemethyl-8-hydroxy-5-deazariboflavin synthase subunit CofG [Candidatus Lokiarchaeota archaeon]